MFTFEYINCEIMTKTLEKSPEDKRKTLSVDYIPGLKKRNALRLILKLRLEKGRKIVNLQ